MVKIKAQLQGTRLPVWGLGFRVSSLLIWKLPKIGSLFGGPYIGCMWGSFLGPPI